MARFDTSGLQDVLDEMTRLGESSCPVAEKMIMAGAEKVKQAWKRSAEEHEYFKGGGKYATGDMINSIGYPRKPTRIGAALEMDIYPQGKNRRGRRNAEVAFVLHYGTSKMRGSRWVDDADRYSGETVVPAMQEIWDDYIKKKG